MKWIKVKNRKPENSDTVLVFAPNCNIIGHVLIGCYFVDSDDWTVYDFNDSKLDELVTHWMPLPDKPI
jgi:hypothetical protein